MVSSVIITCEHAGNEVPEKYNTIFAFNKEVLSSHEGWDPGAFLIAKQISKNLNCLLFSCQITRLLIEANRSEDSPQLFSRFSSDLPKSEKEALLEKIYRPYRNTIQTAIASAPKPVLHFSVHTFTPVLNGEERKVDIGLLFDPDRKMESGICRHLSEYLLTRLGKMSIKFNEPYKGIDDGFTTYLRAKFSDAEYAGIELEVNQKWKNRQTEISTSMAEAIRSILP